MYDEMLRKMKKLMEEFENETSTRKRNKINDEIIKTYMEEGFDWHRTRLVKKIDDETYLNLNLNNLEIKELKVKRG